MKKGIIALSILCTGLLLLDPVKNTSFAIKDDRMDNKVNTNIINKVEENDNNENNIDEKELHSENNTVSKNEDTVKENIDKEESNKENITEDEKQVLSKEDAEKILIGINPKLEYLYQGDENNFSALKEKNLTGYVFLPNVDGDIGYFVDKTNSNVYFFHPSGYLELVK